MTEPPSFWLILPFAVVAGWHMLRAIRLRVSTHGLVGRWTATLILLAYFPAAIAMVEADQATALGALVVWVRENVLTLLVLAAFASESVLRFATLHGAARLAPLAEASNDPVELARVCDALQAIHCHDLAIVGLRRLATMGYAESTVHASLAALYGIQRRFLKAEASARKAIECDPSNGRAHYYLSAALHEQGRLEEQKASRAEAARLGVDLSRFAQIRVNSNG